MPSLPRVLLHLEGAAVLLLCLWLYGRSGASWGLFALLILAPDIAAVGYFAGPRLGSYAYNALHSYVGPIAVGLLLPAAAPIALIWAAHIGGDRLVGYGLKYPTFFKDTHLSRV